MFISFKAYKNMFKIERYILKVVKVNFGSKFGA